jgi:ferric-dicitrate binding protein FerR (iron transport regulator)
MTDDRDPRTDQFEQALIDALRDRDTSPHERWNEDAAWTRLRSRLETEPAIRPAQPVRRSRRWIAIAAGVVITVGAAAYAALVSRSVATPETFAHEVVTPNGARQTLTLDDGSRVTLNAGSRLRWRADFGGRSRDVFLDGEAYFAVTHDASRPFRVHARGAVAHDLGTRFTVRAYRELPHIEVVVAEGSVSIRRDAAAADSAILVTGQLGRLGDTGSPTVESNVSLERWTAWTNGSLVLDGLTLAEAVPQLERWYDATIVLSDPALASRRVTARFHDETLSQMLDALTLALGATWRQSGRSITIAPVKP